MHATLVPTALDTSLIISELKNRRRETALAEMVSRAAEAGAVRSAGALLDLLATREKQVSAALGHGVALLAARSLAVPESRLILGRSRRGIDWTAPDAEPVRMIALLLSPADRTLASHLAAVVRMAALLRQQRSRNKLLEAVSAADLAAVMREALA
jgi:mannitol/fructose-specific phosphotransferase system IIA component (Ntr-type)